MNICNMQIYKYPYKFNWIDIPSYVKNVSITFNLQRDIFLSISLAERRLDCQTCTQSIGMQTKAKPILMVDVYVTIGCCCFFCSFLLLFCFHFVFYAIFTNKWYWNRKRIFKTDYGYRIETETFFFGVRWLFLLFFFCFGVYNFCCVIFLLILSIQSSICFVFNIICPAIVSYGIWVE